MDAPASSSTSLLSPEQFGAESPGSSVFDLPTPALLHRPTSTPTQIFGTIQPSTESQLSRSPSFLVISGGTGCNSLCAAFGDRNCYVLPVSDDGGSSSEIIRVLGGPSIGDVRSRLVRLIPGGAPLDAIKGLLAYRLPVECSEREARDQWRDIVEGRSALWNGIPNDRKEVIRGFLVHFESELLKRAHKNFSFRNGSIGNYFLAAAQGFFRSLPSAIFLFSSITGSQANILPVIVTNHTVTIAAELESGRRLVGQCEISHPVRASSFVSTSNPTPSINVTHPDHISFTLDVDADLTSPVDDPLGETLGKQQNVMFAKRPGSVDEYEALEAPISRIYYINAYGQEIHPPPNPDFLASIASSDVLIYSCGSLWTSIVPCLALKGVASAIARSSSLRAKTLLLNSRNDRETDGYSAIDYINAIVRTLNARYHSSAYGLARGNSDTTYPISAFITHLVFLRGTLIPVDVRHITTLGVRCVEVESASESEGVPQFDATCVRVAIERILSEEMS